MTIKLPEMLSFERKLEVSDALMKAGNWASLNDTSQNLEEAWTSITVTKRQNRSTQSAMGTKGEDMSKPNPVSSDSDDANLPHDKDTLRVNFSLRIIGGLGKPFGCNKPEFEEAIFEKVNEFKEEGLEELSHRYASNIANGRFLWRNRVCAERVLVRVNINKDEVIEFNAYDFPLNNFDAQRDNASLQQLSDAIFNGLNGEDEYVYLQIEAYVQLGEGQHVFPSQKMNMGEKKKELFKLDDCAALHSVKIGNAIRTIDDWYTEEADFPIAIEPFGAVTQRGQAYRKSRIDLYTLMENWVNDKEVNVNQRTFVLANLIRGGVFGGKS